MRIGFLNNQIDNRGTGNAVFNYAHYNETILGNQSKIFTYPDSNHNKEAVDKYVKRFGAIYPVAREYLSDLDALYHIKSGESYQNLSGLGVPYLVHAVFTADPHGDRYAVISEWMGLRDKLPYVPHIVELPNDTSNYRSVLGIPDDATVFGRIGGYDSFDIFWAWDAIESSIAKRPDIYFIFVNTPTVYKHERVHYFPATVNDHAKKAFINTCDAMLHARSRGETFGIAVGEFASQGKAIVTYGQSYERAHIYELKGTALTYDNQEELVNHLVGFDRTAKYHRFYKKYKPTYVMETFKKVFLDASPGS